MSGERGARGEKLDSWKEISDYLGRHIRTCTRWEKRYGLPIKRIGNGYRSRVRATKRELDAWTEHNFVLSRSSRNRIQRASRRGIIIIPSLITIVLALMIIGHSKPNNMEPNNFKIENSTLVILSESGKEIWDYETGISPLESESYYRMRFQIKNNESFSGRVLLPLLFIRDLNNDGNSEVLFSPRKPWDRGTDELICFDNKGGILWRKRTGREIVFGDRKFSSDFVIQGLGVYDFNGDGHDEIVCFSNACNEWPTRLTVFSCDGDLLGEYWNSGQFCDMVFADFDGDMKKEIVVSGLNNEYGKGCLVVFDPMNIRGASFQENLEYKCPYLMKGTELKYILFPRSDVDLALWPVECVSEIDLFHDDLIRVTTGISKLSYEFSYSLDLQNVVLTHSFKQLRRQLELAGRLGNQSESEQAYVNKLRDGFLYRCGNSWVPLAAR